LARSRNGGNDVLRQLLQAEAMRRGLGHHLKTEMAPVSGGDIRKYLT
jgi:hypothetical protein